MSSVLCVFFLKLMKPKARLSKGLMSEIFVRTGERGIRGEVKMEQEEGRKRTIFIFLSTCCDRILSEKARQWPTATAVTLPTASNAGQGELTRMSE